MKRRTTMTGFAAVIAVGFLSFLIPPTGADFTETSTGTVTISVVIPDEPREVIAEQQPAPQVPEPAETEQPAEVPTTPALTVPEDIAPVVPAPLPEPSVPTPSEEATPPTTEPVDDSVVPAPVPTPDPAVEQKEFNESLEE